MEHANENAISINQALIQVSTGSLTKGYFQAKAKKISPKKSAVKTAVKSLWTITCIPSAVRMMSCCTCCPCC